MDIFVRRWGPRNREKGATYTMYKSVSCKDMFGHFITFTAKSQGELPKIIVKREL
jgi:hypothetical protein